MEYIEPMDFHELLPHVSEDALSLLKSMLVFSGRGVVVGRADPNKRVTVKEALAAPFLESVRKPEKEVVASNRMLFPFEYDTTDEGTNFRLRRLIYQEAVQFQ